MKFNSKKFLAGAFLAMSVLLTACSNDGHKYGNLSKDEAQAEVETYYKKINPRTADLKKDISLTSLDSADELPDLNKTYPYTVEGNGKVNVEIFASTEKAGSGKDGILNDIARDFNNQNQNIDGETISVSIRSIPSGTAVDYIASGNHTPDGYTPSNKQWDYNWSNFYNYFDAQSNDPDNRFIDELIGINFYDPSGNRFTTKKLLDHYRDHLTNQYDII